MLIGVACSAGNSGATTLGSVVCGNEAPGTGAIDIAIGFVD